VGMKVGISKFKDYIIGHNLPRDIYAVYQMQLLILTASLQSLSFLTRVSLCKDDVVTPINSHFSKKDFNQPCSLL